MIVITQWLQITSRNQFASVIERSSMFWHFDVTYMIRRNDVSFRLAVSNPWSARSSSMSSASQYETSRPVLSPFPKCVMSTSVFHNTSNELDIVNFCHSLYRSLRLSLFVVSSCVPRLSLCSSSLSVLQVVISASFLVRMRLPHHCYYVSFRFGDGCVLCVVYAEPRTRKKKKGK